MALWEISFRAQYDYPFIAMSGRHPGLPISMWCLFNRELLQVPTRDPATLQSIEREINKAGRVVDKWEEGGDARIFMLQKCTCGDTDSPWNVWEPLDFVDAPPAVYKDGWGYFRLIGFDETRTRDLFREMNSRGPTELIRKRELSLSVLPSSVWVNSLFAELTEKQIDSVLKAHRYGYYTSPRQITTENIARGQGLSRSTYEEHLRKAENRIMGALIPYMQLFSSGERKAEKMPDKGTALDIAEAVQGSV
jgi:predicted DNA binding protein